MVIVGYFVGHGIVLGAAVVVAEVVVIAVVVVAGIVDDFAASTSIERMLLMVVGVVD